MVNKGKLIFSQRIAKIKSKFKFSNHSQIRRRRSNHCLNCQTKFKPSVNFCPNCGQENNHNVAHFGSVVMDFFNNYFSLDSKFSNSLIPFFIKPGYLTKRFVEGKRYSYVNPIRMYLIVSLLFFFIFSMVSQDFYENSINAIEKASNLSDESIKGLNPEYIQLNNNKPWSDFKADKKSSDTSAIESDPAYENEFLSTENFDTYLRLRHNYNISTNQLFDSLNISNLSPNEIHYFKQLSKLDRTEKNIVIGHILKNLPMMMLLLIPLLALLLKLIYVRKSEFYITHLVHALYLHSFAYVVYGLIFLINMYWLDSFSSTFKIWLIFISFNIVCIHSFVSFRQVYNQNWKSTFVKFNMIGFLYFWLLLISICIELYLSVVTF